MKMIRHHDPRQGIHQAFYVGTPELIYQQTAQTEIVEDRLSVFNHCGNCVDTAELAIPTFSQSTGLRSPRHPFALR